MECYDLAKRAIARGNAEALRVLEIEMRDLAGAERDVTSIAIRDVTGRLPMRSPVHLHRLLACSLVT